jgi:hypothetical protein
LLIQYLSISAALIQAGNEIIFHLLLRFSIIQNKSSLLLSDIFLLSQKVDISFFESFFIGQTNHIKSGPAKGPLHASSKYIVKVCLFIKLNIT